MKSKLILKNIFYSLIVIFILLLAYFLTPFPSSIKRMLFPLVAILGFIFLVLGFVLTFIARKEKGRLKLFLMLTGISAIVPFIFSMLHNLFYGLSITFENFKYLFEVLHIACFIVSIIIVPITFIIGIVGSMVLFKSRTDKNKTISDRG